jgi:hypothetical protein
MHAVVEGSAMARAAWGRIRNSSAQLWAELVKGADRALRVVPEEIRKLATAAEVMPSPAGMLRELVLVGAVGCDAQCTQRLALSMARRAPRSHSDAVKQALLAVRAEATGTVGAPPFIDYQMAAPPSSVVLALGTATMQVLMASSGPASRLHKMRKELSQSASEVECALVESAVRGLETALEHVAGAQAACSSHALRTGRQVGCSSSGAAAGLEAFQLEPAADRHLAGGLEAARRAIEECLSSVSRARRSVREGALHLDGVLRLMIRTASLAAQEDEEAAQPREPTLSEAEQLAVTFRTHLRATPVLDPTEAASILEGLHAVDRACRAASDATLAISEWKKSPLASVCADPFLPVAVSAQLDPGMAGLDGAAVSSAHASWMRPDADDEAAPSSSRKEGDSSALVPPIGQPLAGAVAAATHAVEGAMAALSHDISVQAVASSRALGLSDALVGPSSAVGTPACVCLTTPDEEEGEGGDESDGAGNPLLAAAVAAGGTMVLVPMWGHGDESSSSETCVAVLGGVSADEEAVVARVKVPAGWTVLHAAISAVGIDPSSGAPADSPDSVTLAVALREHTSSSLRIVLLPLFPEAQDDAVAVEWARASSIGLPEACPLQDLSQLVVHDVAAAAAARTRGVQLVCNPARGVLAVLIKEHSLVTFEMDMDDEESGDESDDESDDDKE